MNNIIRKLKSWGCDVDGALERFLNNEGMYISFLPMIIREPAFSALGTAIQSGNVTETFEQAHLLKGVLANMGITPLYDIVVKIVEPARRGTLDGLLECYEELMVKYDELKCIIEEKD